MRPSRTRAVAFLAPLVVFAAATLSLGWPLTGEDSGILAYYWGRDIRGQAYLERVRAVRRSLATRLAARA